jgi:hypothetical protein
MKRPWSGACAGFFFAAAVSLAGPTEDAIVAIMRLSERPNYTWVATVADDARTYEIDGKIASDGFSFVKMPAINSVRRKLGRDVTDSRIDAIFRGNVDCVVRTDAGWFRVEELPEPEAISDYERLGAASRSGTIGLPSGALPPGMGGSATHRVRRTAVVAPVEQEKRNYSNLQFAICPPHEELGVIVSSHSHIAVEGDTVSGTLTELGAQLLLVRDGQREITPVQASGTFKIWLRHGTVSRYQVTLQGTLAVTLPKSGRVNLNVSQRTLTVLSDIGTTKVDVPDIARAKLALQ